MQSRKGFSIVLTGNPGDGKTHLLRILESDLLNLPTNPIIEYDASAKTDHELLEIWQTSIEEDRPLCIAINEAVLNNLSKISEHRYAKAIHQIQSAQGQVERAIYYGEDVPDIDLDRDGVIVFDLSRRNVLAKEIVQKVISILADPGRIAVCEADFDDLALNLRLLQNTQVRTRLQSILDRVSRRGFHATVRQLQSLVSFLIFGDRECHQIILESGDIRKALPQLVYLGKGEIFNQLAEVFDPAKISHPIWDEALVAANIDTGEWIEEWREIHSEVAALNPYSPEDFRARKRAFFFFHKYGDELLKIDGSIEAEFSEFIEDAMDEQRNRNALRKLIIRLNRFFGDGANRELQVWQSHRFDNSSRRILYSTTKRTERDFEVVVPKLLETMTEGFDLAIDHVLVRLKEGASISLRVDYPLFELLAQAEHGIPVIAIENNVTRRIWQFMEQLVEPAASSTEYSAEIRVLDLTTGEHLNVSVDKERLQYIEIALRKSIHAIN